MTDDKEAAQLNELLDHAFRNTAQLAADLADHPKAVHVRAGDVSVEVAWQAGQAPQAAPTAPTEAPAAPPPTKQEPADDPGVRYLTAPAVGVLYLAPEPGAAPFVGVGDTVTAGQQVAIIEAMKLMIPFEAEHAGRITKVLKGNGEAVEFGEKVFSCDEIDAA
ncbi:MAG TPA: biotin/lipoyl-containing protein [Pseudonocardiaceae bacterium]|nr:biotin/lipoyl-containing protein [Pseudonocardiaceae bacterium]